MDIELKKVEKFIKKVKGWRFRVFLFLKLPMAFIAGLKIKKLSFNQAIVTAPFSFWNKNPFKSIYFAVLAMGAELSTGILALMHVNKKNEKISMLVVGMESKFYKKATTKIKFICENGNEISDIINKTLKTGKGEVIVANSKGYDENGICVAEFNITWSFKSKI
tara:strand:+ start:604 stop:1095 length:492 start_codon:yes stop_codon:yes gene_type:complete